MEEEKLRMEEKDTTVHVGEEREGERERERLLGHMCGVSMCG